MTTTSIRPPTPTWTAIPTSTRTRLTGLLRAAAAVDAVAVVVAVVSRPTTTARNRAPTPTSIPVKIRPRATRTPVTRPMIRTRATTTAPVPMAAPGAGAVAGGVRPERGIPRTPDRPTIRRTPSYTSGHRDPTGPRRSPATIRRSRAFPDPHAWRPSVSVAGMVGTPGGAARRS